MSIEIKVANGIKITLDDTVCLLDLMSDDDRMAMIESLSCYDNVIKHVVDQISHIWGSTENGSRGSTLCDNKKFFGGGTVLDKVRYQIAKSAPESARALIDVQAATIEQLDSELEKALNELNKLKYPPVRDNY